MDKIIEEQYYEETEPVLHTYSNGAKICYISKIFVSKVENPTRVKSDGSIMPIEVGSPTELTQERLIIGTDAKRTYIRFEFILFKKHPHDECWVRLDTPSYGLSFTPKTMRKIAKIIEQFGGNE